MANITNQAYVGNAGELTLDTDTHFGVTSFTLTPTTFEEQVPDIAGDIQSIVGATTWVADIEFNQDHVTDGSISNISDERAGEVIPFSYTPKDGGRGKSGNLRMKPSVFGGGTGRHTATLSLNVVGTPATVEPGA